MIRKILRCLLTWRIRYSGWEEFQKRVDKAFGQNQAVIVVTHDIGMSKGNKPGCGNTLMAWALKRVADRYPTVPILAQLGVALAAKEIGVPVTKTIGPPKTDTPLNRSGADYNSLTVIRDQKRWCQENEQFPALALTLTNPIHMGRVQWIMEREGFEVLPIPLLSSRQKDYMDPESLYLSVRLAGKTWWGMILVYLREVAARLLFLKNGWM